MTSALASPLTVARVVEAIRDCASISPDKGEAAAKAAAAALALHLAREGEALGLHPHDCYSFRGEGAAVMADILDDHPEVEAAWRQQLAAVKLARLIARAVKRHPEESAAALAVLAAATEEHTSFHSGAGLIDGDCLDELASIAVGEG